jgi:addiction module HigA family antidote
MIKHPGRILFEDFMTPLAISANRLATNAGVNRSTIGRLIAGDQRLTPEMAARLGAYFGVPPRWWLSMQAEFDDAELAARPELRDDVIPWEADPDLLLTPTGVLRLDAVGVAEREPPSSIPRAALEAIPQGAGSPPDLRNVRVVRYENGSLALVGDAS